MNEPIFNSSTFSLTSLNGSYPVKKTTPGPLSTRRSISNFGFPPTEDPVFAICFQCLLNTVHPFFLISLSLPYLTPKCFGSVSRRMMRHPQSVVDAAAIAATAFAIYSSESSLVQVEVLCVFRKTFDLRSEQLPCRYNLLAQDRVRVWHLTSSAKTA